MRLRIDFGYDGTHFHGWAKQPGGLRTVQQKLEEALAMLLRVSDLFLIVAGRTDAGVHARNQTCHVDIDSDLLEKLYGREKIFESRYAARRLNGALKRLGAADIVIHGVTVVDDAFDARFSAIARRYEYRLAPRYARIDPLATNYTAITTDDLEEEILNETSEWLLGLRDFGTFCKPREGATTVRELQEFRWRSDANGVLVAKLRADAFCHGMVRTLVGGVAAVAAGRVTKETFKQLVFGKTRTSHFKVMPAKGLSLEEVIYPSPEEYAERAAATRAKRP